MPIPIQSVILARNSSDRNLCQRDVTYLTLQAAPCIALIVSAGRGHRLGGEIPKQYLPLAGKSVLSRTIEAFSSHPSVDFVRVVIHPDDETFYRDAVGGLELLEPVLGGAERQDSVRLGLESLAELGAGKVLIHDSVRPFVDHELISRVIDSISDENGVIPAVAVSDTLKRGTNGTVVETVDRRELWRVQTPQGFPFTGILEAHRRAAGEVLTDDAAVAEAAGLSVRIVDGAEQNIKITRQEDMTQAERLLSTTPGMTRVGTGFDVHRFKDGDFVTICGVKIAHSHSLEGHSDADVGLHALTDAILGAIGGGDIGIHFPPSDPQWQDAPSDIFLRHAVDQVAVLGGRIQNLDITIICEAPRIAPHREAMIEQVAAITGLKSQQINLKGTTTEKLGFTGRGEGIAAQAIAAVFLPDQGG